MACLKFSLLAPVFWETSDPLEFESIAREIVILSQDGSDYILVQEVLSQSPTPATENQSAACASEIPNTTHTLVIPKTSRTSGFPNTSRTSGIPNTTHSSGIPNNTHALRISNDARISGIPKSDLLSSLPSNLDRNYLNFPFLTDRKTFDYLNEKYTKVMFIMRGLSGSGKTSIVSMIKSAFKHVVVCSADDFFYKQDGGYVFDETLLGAAHETCQKKAKKACSGQVPIVVIDNTNVRRWELRFYAELANSSGYVVIVVQPKTPWKWNAEELAARSLHGVSVGVLERKISMFDDVIPIYYGWFPNKTHSKLLTGLCLKSFGECLAKFSDFKSDLLKELRIQPENTDEETINRILAAYSEGTSNLLLHCTSKFCARGKVPDAEAYHKRLDVRQACGRMCVLQVAGLVLTHKSIGARVSLGSSESVFFARPEEVEWDINKSSGSHKRRQAAKSDLLPDAFEEFYEVVKNGNRKAKKNPARFLKKQQRKLKNSLKIEKHVDSDSVMENNGRAHLPHLQDGQLENAAGQSGINEVDEESVSLAEMFPALNFSNRTRSAHFTIKVTGGVESREVNFDLLQACDIEAASSYSKSTFVPVSRGHACYYGASLCCVYFEKPLHVQTLFSGCY